MQDFLRRVLRGALRVLFKGVIGRPIPERLQRAWMAMVAASTWRAGGVQIERGTWGVPGERIRPRECTEGRALLYLHGGGYTIGSPRTHRALTSHLAVAARCEVVVPDYRLAPEHPYPAALQDALAAYRALLDQMDPTCVALAGDSAGAGLALAAALALRDQGLPMPRALVLLSPWTDLALTGDTIDGLAGLDPMLGRAWLQRAGDAYRGDLAAADPRVSPLHADLAGLPPTLIQVGSDEILLADSRRFADKARASGVDVRFEVEAGYWHDFQIHAGVLRAADAAIGRIGRFLQDRWNDA